VAHHLGLGNLGERNLPVASERLRSSVLMSPTNASISGSDSGGMTPRRPGWKGRREAVRPASGVEIPKLRVATHRVTSFSASASILRSSTL